MVSGTAYLLWRPDLEGIRGAHNTRKRLVLVVMAPFSWKRGKPAGRAGRDFIPFSFIDDSCNAVSTCLLDDGGK